PEGSDAVVAHARAWLAVVRWWAGDLPGADAVLRDVADDAFTVWVRAEVALAEGDYDAAAQWAEQLIPDDEITDAARRSLVARLALVAGDDAQAFTFAKDAYQVGVAAGGFDPGIAARVHAWTLLDRGAHEEAAAVADLLQARVGRHDVVARLHVALIRLALATSSKERTTAEKRVRDLREL